MNRAWLLGSLLLLVCLGCYANALRGGFHYDDFHSIVDNPSVRSLANLPAFFTDPTTFSADAEKAMYRPVLLATFALNYALGGYGAVGYHVGNLLVHTGCCLLVWALARRLLGSLQTGWFCALLFAVHPLATEPVNYVSSRSESLMALFYLAAVVLHLHRDRGTLAGRLSFVAVGLGLLTKPVAITAPAALWLCDRWQARPAWRWGRYAAHGLLIAGYLLLTVANRSLSGSLRAPVRDGAAQVWTQAKATGYYLKLLFMPWGLSVEHAFTESTSPWQAAVAGGLALTASLGFLAWRGRNRLPGWSVAWAGLVLLPTAAMPLNVLVNERRLYLVLAAFALLWGYLQARQRRPWMAAGLPLLAVLTVGRNPAWRDELTLWQDAAAKAPGMYPTQANLGKALQLAGRPEAALAAYHRALAIDPRYAEPYNNIATIYQLQGRVDEAIALYLQALERYPNSEEIRQNLADAYAKSGRLDEAVRAYAAALAIDDRNGAIWANYGQTLMEAGQPERAAYALRQTIARLPDQPEPYNNLGNLYSNRGDLAQAVAMYREALARQPVQRAEVLGNLADTYRQMGRLDEARTVLSEAIAVDPGLGRSHYYLGKLERQAGRRGPAEEALGRAVELEPQFPRAWVELAELRAEGGDPVAAIVRFREAVRLDPRYGRAWYGLAQALERDRRQADAAAAYRRFLDVWTATDERRRQAEERLRRLESDR